jgi:DNA segregation ATPase FtsK/SpoIIIE, S-DNA-T family
MSVHAYLILAGVVLVAYPVARVAIGVGRFAMCSWSTRRHYLTALRVRICWRWLMRGLGLAKVDHHKTDARKARGKKGQVIAYPRVRFRPDHYGFVATVRTLPGVGGSEWEAQTEHLAHAWRVYRVHVSRAKPGQITVRALRRDPLADSLTMADCPAGVWADGRDPAHVYCGRDEWAKHRYLAMANLAGVTIGGLAGYGKTSFVGSLLYQWSGSAAVQFALIDGKGGADYEDFAQRAWIYTGDSIDRALAAAEALHAVMRFRTAQVRKVLGVKNAWHRGPSPEFPMIVIVWDECHTFFDLPPNDQANKAQRAKIQRLISLCAQLVKKGRSVLITSIFITQKQTGDAIPTAIRDNCAAGASFAVRTKEAAVAGLGEGIRDYPALCPTTLKERPTYQGVCTVSLGDGAEDFVRLRVPEITEDTLNERAKATAHLKRGEQEIIDARRWERTAPQLPDEDWLIPLERLDAERDDSDGVEDEAA